MTDDADRFAHTAAHYARARPGYGEAAIRYLTDRFDVDDTARVLDLGCGTGQIAVPMATHAGTVVAMDPNEAMLEEGRKRAADAGVANVEWRRGSDADLDDSLAPLRLTTMGRSFHWVDQERTLAWLQQCTEPGGGIALLDDPEWFTQGQADWQTAVYDVVDAYVEDLPERRHPDEIEYDRPWDELLATEGLAAVETGTFDVERTWSLERIGHYVASLSFTTPGVRSETLESIERDLRERLADVGAGPFVQRAQVRVVAGCA